MQEREKYKLSTYQTIETLRETSMCRVELVESSLDSLKYIKKTYHSDKRAVYRILSGIECQYIPKVYEVFFGEDTVVIEQYIEGSNLEELINEKMVFSKADVKRIMNSLLTAIETLHKNKVLHRDIKPANIIINKDGDAVLIDYSIARIYHPEQSSDTEYLGTAGYAAPEQYGFSQSDYRTDIYAFGVTMKHIVSRKNVSRRVYTAISRCAEFDPSHRFQSIDELVGFIKQGRKIKLCMTLFGSVAVVLVAVLFILKIQGNNKSLTGTESGVISGENSGSVSQGDLIYEMTDQRIVDVNGAENTVPCLPVKEKEKSYAKVNLHDGNKETQVTAVQDNNSIIVIIDGKTTFTFTDDMGISPLDYPDGTTYGEIVFYDLNNDGALEIIPVITNAVKTQLLTGNISFLKNYTLGWCVYYDNGVYNCADGYMMARLDSFEINESTPGCIYADFPSYYTIKDGRVVLCW